MYSIDHCLIVGAGISGLLVAKHLKANGVQVTILDKGRNPGGRLSTRHLGDATFDHGAQFITTRDRAFRDLVERWVLDKAVKPWYKGPLGNMRYVGAGGMANLPAYLAKDLEILQSHKVTYLNFEKNRWKVTAQPHGEKKTRHFTADFLVLTPPVPQSLELLRESNVQLDFDDEDELNRIQYSKCITVLAQLNGPAGLPNPGAMDLNLETLRWLGDNFAKQVSKAPGSLTINSSPKFAQAHWDSPDEVRLPLLVNAAKPFIRADIVSAVAHRWAYSEPTRIYREKQPFRKNYLFDANIRLGMCGDSFAGGRVEAAAVSGMQLAQEMSRAV